MAPGRKPSMNDTHLSHCELEQSGIIDNNRSGQEVQSWARLVLTQPCTQWIGETFPLLVLAVAPRALSMPTQALPLSYTLTWKTECFLEKTILRWALYMADSVLWLKRTLYIKPFILQSHDQSVFRLLRGLWKTGNPTSVHGFYYRPCHHSSPEGWEEGSMWTGEMASI